MELVAAPRPTRQSVGRPAAISPKVSGGQQLRRGAAQQDVRFGVDLAGSARLTTITCAPLRRAKAACPAAGQTAPEAPTHGFLSLSLLSDLVNQVYVYPGRKSALKYGFDRVRFTSAVPVDAERRAAGRDGRGRGREPRRGACDLGRDARSEPQQRPALVARWLVQMRY